MPSEKKPRPIIKPFPDGPYQVKDLENFSNQKGPIQSKPKLALCRCGASANKPFCDGTHAKVGFSSAKLEGRIEDRRESYRGEKITIHDNRGVCAHAGRCTDGLPSVFRLKQEPWIDPNGAAPEEIIATVGQCPSGALSTSAGSAEPRDRAGEPAIFVAPNGPYIVTGGLELLDTDRGEGASAEKFTLCRCGGSRNKPFCDGSHWHRKFRDDRN
jgi:CDGSH-type Zn-finger protein